VECGWRHESRPAPGAPLLNQQPEMEFTFTRRYVTAPATKGVRLEGS
jgi:hypothetical protein